MPLANTSPQIVGADIRDEEEARAATEAMRARLQGTNINELTLLATDYLNHFNEVVMLLDMISDMPELLEEVQAWEPRSYQDHFRQSTFSDRDLAVEAYDHVPREFKKPFEQTISQVDYLILLTAAQIESALQQGLEGEALTAEIASHRDLIHRLLDVASSIIHGASHVMDQSEIDLLLSSSPAPESDGGGQSQADIDALFD